MLGTLTQAGLGWCPKSHGLFHARVRAEVLVMTLVHHRLQHDGCHGDANALCRQHSSAEHADATTLALPAMPRLTWHLILSFVRR